MKGGDISAKMMSGFLALVLGYMLSRLVWWGVWQDGKAIKG